MQDRQPNHVGPVRLALVVNGLVIEPARSRDVVVVRVRPSRFRGAELHLQVASDAGAGDEPAARLLTTTAAMEPGQDAPVLPGYVSAAPPHSMPGPMRRHRLRHSLVLGALIAGFVLVAIRQRPGSADADSRAQPPSVPAAVASDAVVNQSSPSLHAAGIDTGDNSDTPLAHEPGASLDIHPYEDRSHITDCARYQGPAGAAPANVIPS